MTKKLARNLTYRNITNLVTVEHTVFVNETEVPAVSTGQLGGIMTTPESVFLLIGGHQVSVPGTEKVTIHSTHLGLFDKEIVSLAREAGGPTND